MKIDTKIEQLIKEKVAEEVKKYFFKGNQLLYGLWKEARITNKDVEEAEAWLDRKVDNL